MAVTKATEGPRDVALVRRRRLLVLGLLALATLAAAVASLMVGSRMFPPGDVWQALTSPDGGETDVIVRGLRVPRTALGLLAGIALGVGGAVMQGHTRNPLADPSILGITYGAAFAVVLSVFALGISGVTGYIWFGFGGALVASVAVFAIGTAGAAGPGGAGVTPVTLALAGTAISWLMYALTSIVVLMDRQSMETFRFWRVGAIAGRDADTVWQIVPFVAAGLVLAVANAPALNALALGEDTARALGQRVLAARVVGVAAVTLLTGAVVAACGPIGFVGLIVPHVARFIAGPDHRWLLPCAGLLGAALLLLADVAGRVVAPPGELQVGIMLAVLGTPFFVVLVRRPGMVRL